MYGTSTYNVLFEQMCGNNENVFQDLILLITYTIHHHPFANIREKLIQLLLNLKKKPKDDERKVILSSM